MIKRKSGILLHITSLPGDQGCGSLGKNAYRFVDFLVETGQKYWQILPLGPTGYGDSPYQCYSAFAGNTMLIDLEKLADDGLIPNDNYHFQHANRPYNKRFQEVTKWKSDILSSFFLGKSNMLNKETKEEYYRFLDEHFWWLNDYALFMACQNKFGNEIWNKWDSDIKFRKENSLKKYQELLNDEIELFKFLQFLFFKQWFQLKSYANEKGIEIIGDVPLYVSTDSADIWANPDIFSLDENLMPVLVGGVPPDYFSETGQLWGNPVFNWEKLKHRKYDWWMARLHFNLRMFDLVRIDHFRGLESFWVVPASETTAINGQWLSAKGYEMLDLLKSQIGYLPLIAEDLGIITPEVEALRLHFQLPGMKVLQFAFGSDEKNEHLPHNYSENTIAYTGTHDNNTTLGWLKSAKGFEKNQIRKYIRGKKKKALKYSIELAFASVAHTAILPMQDILQLDSRSRMNIPGTPSGNWGWRFGWDDLKVKHKKFLRYITEKYNRIH